MDVSGEDALSVAVCSVEYTWHRRACSDQSALRIRQIDSEVTVARPFAATPFSSFLSLARDSKGRVYAIQVRGVPF